MPILLFRHFMISGLKGAGVKDLTQFLMEQACIFLLLLYISHILQIIVLVPLKKQLRSFFLFFYFLF